MNGNDNPKRNSLGMSSLICGIVGSVFGMIPLFGIPAIACGLVGWALGVGGVYRVRHNQADNKWTARIGVILSVLAVIVGVIGSVIMQHAIDNIRFLGGSHVPVRHKGCAASLGRKR